MTIGPRANWTHGPRSTSKWTDKPRVIGSASSTTDHDHSLCPTYQVFGVCGFHGQRVTRWDSKTADELYFNSVARKYWAEKNEHFNELDYDALRLAYKSINLYYQLRIPKWIGRRLPVGSVIARWDHANVATCPRCNHANETHLHVISCQHPGAIARTAQWLNQLELWLVKQHTQPDIRFGVISLIRASTRSLPWTPPQSSEPSIRHAFQQQQRLGIDDIMFGWWGTGWAEAQQGYLLSIARRTTGKRWLSRLIKKTMGDCMGPMETPYGSLRYA